MDFTEIYPVASGSKDLVSFSPGGHLILSAVQDRLIVRRTDTLQIARRWQLDATPTSTNNILPPPKTQGTAPDSPITHLGWSQDSEYLFGACAKQGVVHVYKLREEEWSCMVDAGAEGLVKAEWAPDGRHILCFSQFGLRVTIWSLVTGTATYIQYPSHSDSGHDFSPDGRYLAVAERHRSKDSVGIYDALDSYKLARHFNVPTSSLASISISPNGMYLAVWEGVIEYKLLVFNLVGVTLGTFTPETDPGLGIKGARWHPNSTFLAVHGFDDKIHILDSTSWTAITTIEPLTRIPGHLNIWHEPERWMEATEGRGFLSYERIRATTPIGLSRSDSSKPNANLLEISWNVSGTMFLVRFDSAPRACWIYDFPTQSETFSPRLRSVLIHSKPILHAQWNTVRKSSLVITTGQGSIYIWSDEWETQSGATEETAECIGVPAKNFEVRDMQWGADGRSLILVGKDSFCCAFEVENA